MAVMELPNVVGAYMTGVTNNPYKDRVAWGTGQAQLANEYAKLMATEAAQKNPILYDEYAKLRNAYGRGTENVDKSGYIVSTSAMNPSVNKQMLSNQAFKSGEENLVKNYDPRMNDPQRTLVNMWGGWGKPETTGAWQDAAKYEYWKTKRLWDINNQEQDYWSKMNPDAEAKEWMGVKYPAGYTAADAARDAQMRVLQSKYPRYRQTASEDYSAGGPWSKMLDTYQNAQNWKVGGSPYSGKVPVQKNENIKR